MKRLLLSLFFVAAMTASASATLVSLPFSFVNGQIIDATQVMANYNALANVINGNIDTLNIGSAGIQPNQIKCSTIAGCTITVGSNSIGIITSSSTVTPLQVAAISGQSADVFDIWSNGLGGGNKLFAMTSTGAVTLFSTFAVSNSSSTYSAGTGVPAGACAIGAVFQRTDAPSPGTALYLCQPANTWSNIGAVSVGGAFGGIYTGTTFDPDTALATSPANDMTGCGDGAGNFYGIRRDSTPKIWVSKYTYAAATGVASSANNGGAVDGDYTGGADPMATCTLLGTNVYTSTDGGRSATNKIKIYATTGFAMSSFALPEVGQPLSIVNDGTSIYFINDCQAGAGCAGGVNIAKLYKMTTAGVFTALATLNAAYGNAGGWLIKGPDGNLWTTVNNHANIYVYTTAGVLNQTLNAGNVATLPAVMRGLAFDANGLPWAVNQSAGAWTFYRMNSVTPTTSTTFTTTWFSAVPLGLFSTGDGNLYTSTSGTQCMLKITPAGVISPNWCQWDSLGPIGGGAGTRSQNIAADGISGLVLLPNGTASTQIGGWIDFFGPVNPGGWTLEKITSGIAVGTASAGNGTIVTLPGTAFTGINTYMCHGDVQMATTTANQGTNLKLDNVSASTVRIGISGGTVALVRLKCMGG